MNWIIQLMLRNPLLFWYGCICLFGGLICTVLIQTTSLQVNNINAFIKPMKFFFSVAIFCFNMGWILLHLQKPSFTNTYSIMVIVVMSFELLVITWQSANGRLSHFNVSTKLYATLFTLMGIAISILTIWTLVAGFYFFTINNQTLDAGYLWGIRLGILLFVFFLLKVVLWVHN